MKGILHHLDIEAVKVIVWDCIFDDYQPVLVEGSNALLEVPWTETTIGKLIPARLDRNRVGRGKSSSRYISCARPYSDRGRESSGKHCENEKTGV